MIALACSQCEMISPAATLSFRRLTIASALH
jgi:hypothetical protein